MNSDEPPPDVPNEPADASPPSWSEGGGSNGATAGNGTPRFDGPIARKPTPEELEWVLQQFSPEDLAAGLREITLTGGVSSEEFLRAIEHAARDDG